MLKQTLKKIAVPNIQWFEFVTGMSEPQFITRRSEAIQPDPSHSSILHGIDIGPSLQIRSVHAACPEHSAKSQKTSLFARSNIKTGSVLPAGSFATISIAELQQAADAAAAATAASDPNPRAPVVFEIHVRSGSRARQLLPTVEVAAPIHFHLLLASPDQAQFAGLCPAVSGAAGYNVSSCIKLQLS